MADKEAVLTELNKWLNYTEQAGTEKRSPLVLRRALGMLTNSKAMWSEIAQEKGGLVETFIPYTLWIYLLPMLVWGIAIHFFFAAMITAFGGNDWGLNLATLILSMVKGYLEVVLFILIAGKLMQVLAPNFDAKPSWVLSCRVLVYAATPSFLILFICPIPFLGVLFELVGLVWTIILFVQGYRKVLQGH